MVIIREKREWEDEDVGTGGRKVLTEGDLILGGEHTIQYADDVL